MPDQPPLFDLPEPARRPAVSRTEIGRAGMTYVRTVTADIHLRHRESLCKLAVRVFNDAPTVVIGEVDDTADDHQTRPLLRRDWWTVTVKLSDVAAFRQIAVDACPPDNTTARAEIATSLATAWHWAAEPYAPLRHIPGITWTPVEVVVEHRPTRSQQGR